MQEAPTSTKLSDSQADEPFTSNGRYRIHRILGRGGMAIVYDVTDQNTQRRLALKRLQSLSDAVKQKRNLELFEREFHTLRQLAHPRIVSVYDFAIDDEGAYYVMELLEGGDLQELAPLPWRRACAVARDICSALSLLHSRRFVHRDVSPRNVRCTKQGPAKLIDFGAMAPIGPTKLLVGTPPCCAPESVHMQTVDGRTDLFSLGATLYYMLVGHHAYPARHFPALPLAWRAGFMRPSELVSDIPAELDALVLDLLRLEPDARPASANEVMQRLSAIDGEEGTEEQRAASAYLATPTLVGRDAQLARVQRRVHRVTGGRSRSVLIEGPAGVGRTRFLDACLLDATLSGQTVVRADSDDAVSGDYGAVRTIARQLIEQIPQIAHETVAPLLEPLAQIIPELAGPSNVANDVPLPRAHLQRALHTWFTNLSKRQPLVLAIDDFHRIDEPSAALIALLERDSTEHELCVLITVESGAVWTAESARKLLEALTTLRLEPLSVEDSERLLQSVFGSVPHLTVLAHTLRELCAGSPRDLLRLAQHLIDRGTVRYTEGAWTLPSEIDPSDLPRGLSEALAARVASLPETPRELACALALCPDESFSFDECIELSGAARIAQRVVNVEALLSADIARRADGATRLSQRSWVPLLRASLTSEREVVLERRLAELFERRSGQDFRAAQHWFRANEPSRALDLLVHHAEVSQEYTARGPEIFLRYLLSLPEGWFETFQQGMRYCDSLQRPRRHKFALLSRMVGIMALLNTHAADLLGEIFVDLHRDSGYDDWEVLDPSMDPKTRIITAVTRAKARYDAMPEHERVLDPVAAIRFLTRAVVAASAPISMALDVTTLRSLPRLKLFATLSPALEASNILFEGVEARCTGRLPRARALYAQLLEIVGRPNRGGMEESFAAYMKLGVMNGLGMIEAGLGLRSCLEWAAELANHPSYEVNATVIRMLDCLFQGDVHGAEQQKRLADRLRIQNSGRQMFEGGHLIWELHAHALCSDLTRVRHASEEIASLAKRYPQWDPVLRYAMAEYHRMTRDFERARGELEAILEHVTAGSHQIWPYVANAHVLTLLELGEDARGLALAEEYASHAAIELDYVPTFFGLSHALALAQVGDTESAAAADRVIARLKEEGVGGLHLGVAEECRARIALRLHDSAGFARHIELCRQLFCAFQNTALTAKYHRLLQEGRRVITGATDGARATPDSTTHHGTTGVELALAGCRDDDQRARLALTLLTRPCGASAGLLYLLRESELVCAAQFGDVPAASALLPKLQAYLELQRDDEDDHTGSKSEQTEMPLGDWSDPDGRVFKPVLLSHYDRGRPVSVGVVVLIVEQGREFELPLHTAIAISQFYAARGSTSMMLLSD